MQIVIFCRTNQMCSNLPHVQTPEKSPLNYRLQLLLLTRQSDTWHSECPAFGSHWRWKMQPECRLPCSQRPASRPPAGQAVGTAQQYDRVHHRLVPRYCRGTWPHQALASIHSNSWKGEGKTKQTWEVIIIFSSFVGLHIRNLLPFQSLNFTDLMQCWQTVSMVKEYTVKRSIHAIVDIVHQSPVIGSFIFLWRKQIFQY